MPDPDPDNVHSPEKAELLERMRIAVELQTKYWHRDTTRWWHHVGHVPPTLVASLRVARENADQRETIKRLKEAPIRQVFHVDLDPPSPAEIAAVIEDYKRRMFRGMELPPDMINPENPPC